MTIDFDAIKRALSGAPTAQGKTKQIFPLEGSDKLAILAAKDDITAGDGAMHDVIVGKRRLANMTTCAVFRTLKACGVPVAFIQEIDPFTPEGAGSEETMYGFVAPMCTMLLYEVVLRREAHGSYLDRQPHLPKGHLFNQLVLEYFLKTTGKDWKGTALVKDDPLMAFKADGTIDLYYPGHSSKERPTMPKGALVGQKPFLTLTEEQVFTHPNEHDLLEQMGILARQVFLILEKLWHLQGKQMVDIKIEFGLDADGKLHVADVIDNDSWRLVGKDGAYICKEAYRQGGDLNDVTRNYELVTALAQNFSIPRQQIVLWRGSESDDFTLFYASLKKLGLEDRDTAGLTVTEVTCSAHKKPALAYVLLQKYAHDIPDSVLIAKIGMSNGAGPTLAANTTIPVITVPAGYEKFPDDIWSSLRAPSLVPVMTVPNEGNAMLAALNMLSARNAAIYAAVRGQLETRLTN